MHCGMRSPVSPLNGESVHENISIDGACAPGAKGKKKVPPPRRARPPPPDLAKGLKRGHAHPPKMKY